MRKFSPIPILSASFREADVTQVHTHSLMDSAEHGPARELCRRHLDTPTV